ncbi:hypothetical protein T11_4790 [Trichinella zimbabwensis]|uniref:Uncharacterized protein n=1 Tax=Trichinella zimbabwensis TaxID=268475 RepID=A0A0V1H504_9BILA|nr:hypothetical protein T11_4790 [Trichinella zimbabwensis]
MKSLLIFYDLKNSRIWLIPQTDRVDSVHHWYGLHFFDQTDHFCFGIAPFHHTSDVSILHFDSAIVES